MCIEANAQVAFERNRESYPVSASALPANHVVHEPGCPAPADALGVIQRPPIAARASATEPHGLGCRRRGGPRTAGLGGSGVRPDDGVHGVLSYRREEPLGSGRPRRHEDRSADEGGLVGLASYCIDTLKPRPRHH